MRHGRLFLALVAVAGSGHYGSYVSPSTLAPEIRLPVAREFHTGSPFPARNVRARKRTPSFFAPARRRFCRRHN